jgi:hypothetical protein
VIVGEDVAMDEANNFTMKDSKRCFEEKFNSKIVEKGKNFFSFKVEKRGDYITLVCEHNGIHFRMTVVKSRRTFHVRQHFITYSITQMMNAREMRRFVSIISRCHNKLISRLFMRSRMSSKRRIPYVCYSSSDLLRQRNCFRMSDWNARRRLRNVSRRYSGQRNTYK